MKVKKYPTYLFMDTSEGEFLFSNLQREGIIQEYGIKYSLEDKSMFEIKTDDKLKVQKLWLVYEKVKRSGRAK